MDLLQLLVILIGLVVIGVLIYLLVTGQPVPQGMKVILLIAVALLVVLCLAHASGCNSLRPTPQ